MVCLNVKQHGSACSGSTGLPVVRVPGFTIGTRRPCLCVSQVTQFAGASRV